MAKTKQQGHKSDVLNMSPQSLISLLATLGGSAMVLGSKEFKSGKAGFGGNGTATIKCGKGTYKFSVSINCTAIDSEKVPLPKEAREAILALDSVSLKDLGLDKMSLSAREFTSGKVGFYYGDKLSLKVGEHVVRLQVGIPIVAWHSDTWPAARPTASKKADKDQAPAE